MNIFDTLQNKSQFTTLVASLRDVGLSDMLSSNGQFTVFAPTDVAFFNLPTQTFDVKYHVTLGNFSYKQLFLQIGSTVPTLHGARLNVDANSYKNYLKINGVKVVTRDIKCTNGVIHVVKEVFTLTPPQKMSP